MTAAYLYPLYQYRNHVKQSMDYCVYMNAPVSGIDPLETQSYKEDDYDSKISLIQVSQCK